MGSFRDVYRAVRAKLGGSPPSSPPSGTPTSSSTKAQIVSWLLSKGVELDEPALNALTKAELLELVADLVDDEVES